VLSDAHDVGLSGIGNRLVRKTFVCKYVIALHMGRERNLPFFESLHKSLGLKSPLVPLPHCSLRSSRKVTDARGRTAEYDQSFNLNDQ
jgi:hypothetical protein